MRYTHKPDGVVYLYAAVVFVIGIAWGWLVIATVRSAFHI